MEMLMVLLQDMYDLYRIPVDMADVGHSGASRKRVYILVVLRAALCCHFDPLQLSYRVFDAIRSAGGTRVRDYITASNLEVQVEAMEVSRMRGLPWACGASLKVLLTDREREVARTLDAMYLQRTGKRPSKSPDLCYFLGDNPAFAVTWSAASQKLPTLRRNCATSKMWIPSKQRWMTSQERFLGPVFLSLSLSLSPSLFVYGYLYPSLALHLFLYIFLLFSLSASPCLSVSLSLSLSLSLSVSVHCCW